MKRKLKATEGGWTEYVSNVEVLRDKYLESERQFVFLRQGKKAWKFSHSEDMVNGNSK